MGDVLLTAYLTPGHTRGSTSRGREPLRRRQSLCGGVPGRSRVQPRLSAGDEPVISGHRRRLPQDPSRAGDAEADIWLAQHNEYYDLEGKRERAKTEGVDAWIDPEGYRRFIAGKKRAFEDEVDAEMGVTKD